MTQSANFAFSGVRGVFALVKGQFPVDFTQPAGEAALVPPGSLSWQIFKNPVALFVGGVTAVILELAEPRVRSGVWDHTSFRTDPLPRMERTALAAMVTVYGARSVAEKMILSVRKMHDRVQGTTPTGEAYHANDPELLNWVQATAAFGFLEAYATFVRPLDHAERDHFYGEGVTAAKLYGAVGAPTSVAELEAEFQAMRPRLERSKIVFEFLDLMQRTSIFPWPLQSVQLMLLRAAVEITPPWVREILGLDANYGLRPWEARLIRTIATLSDRIVIPSTPAAQACRRLGLPVRTLLRSRPSSGRAV
jgi:uncharacterized protein (DUF2236 family)